MNPRSCCDADGVAARRVSVRRIGHAMSERDDALHSFIDKWRARWPEWARRARCSCRATQRDTALAWVVVAAGTHRCRLGRQRPAAGRGQAGLVGGGTAGLGAGPPPAPARACALQTPAGAVGAAGRGACRRCATAANGRSMRDEAVATLRAVRAKPSAAIEAGAVRRPVAAADRRRSPPACCMRGSRTIRARRPCRCRLLAAAGERGPPSAWGRELLARWPATAGTRPRRPAGGAGAGAPARSGDAARAACRRAAALLTAWRAARG